MEKSQRPCRILPFQRMQQGSFASINSNISYPSGQTVGEAKQEKDDDVNDLIWKFADVDT